MKKALLLGAAAILIGGCASPKYESRHINLSGFPPEYKAGYDDGCASVNVAGIVKKDAKRYKSDKQYAQGWKDGFDLCKKR